MMFCNISLLLTETEKYNLTVAPHACHGLRHKEGP